MNTHYMAARSTRCRCRAAAEDRGPPGVDAVLGRGAGGGVSAGTPIVVFGAGGFGREVVVLIRDINKASPGTLGPAWVRRRRGCRISTCARRWELPIWATETTPSEDVPADVHFVVAIGTSSVRARVTDELVKRGWRPATLVHPSAWIGDCVALGPGSVVCAGNILTTNITFGAGAQINLSCTIGHDVVGRGLRHPLAGGEPLGGGDHR